MTTTKCLRILYFLNVTRFISYLEYYDKAQSQRKQMPVEYTKSAIGISKLLISESATEKQLLFDANPHAPLPPHRLICILAEKELNPYPYSPSSYQLSESISGGFDALPTFPKHIPTNQPTNPPENVPATFILGFDATRPPP